MGKKNLVFDMKKGTEIKVLKFEVKTGIGGAIRNARQAYKISRELLKADKSGWIITRVHGDDPALVARFVGETKFQESKGEEKAKEDLLESVNIFKRKKKKEVIV